MANLTQLQAQVIATMNAVTQVSNGLQVSRRSSSEVRNAAAEVRNRATILNQQLGQFSVTNPPTPQDFIPILGGTNLAVANNNFQDATQRYMRLNSGDRVTPSNFSNYVTQYNRLFSMVVTPVPPPVPPPIPPPIPPPTPIPPPPPATGKGKGWIWWFIFLTFLIIIIVVIIALVARRRTQTVTTVQTTTAQPVVYAA